MYGVIKGYKTKKYGLDLERTKLWFKVAFQILKGVQCTCQIVNILLCIYIINVKIQIINYTFLL